jgi:small-conductance mechanosensitive channel
MKFELVIIAIEIVSYCFSLFILKKIGKKLERIKGNGFVSLWLSEIGSDVRIYGSLTLTLLFIGIVSATYFKWLLPLLYTLMRILISVWVFIVFVAALEVGEKYLKNDIEHSDISNIDKRNYLTLIPVVASVLKIFSYAVVSLSILASVGVNITPILNVGAIAIAALMFAGSETIKDVIATLKFFITRKLYVGSIVKVNNLRLGKVIRITIIDTTIETEVDGNVYTQIINNGLIHTIVHIKPSPELIPRE